ncbi:hypothetical protein I6F30_12355 [Bradyrhizobium sp. NBAIM20]|uniref:hypothetical protein n=1 Tax=unclassified Bradyrhizobium TaxID=2631580 RepID=UPI001CD206EB|nr:MULTISPECIES: hypothetical protein [unclassified Bradyrhizobium]MCA1411926.1 hypothetical protein [Bradyrhizobium sp. NBAIM20]MCA1460842.1 hypothetical protein [Bradyrhizobium sp. NBAIM18]
MSIITHSPLIIPLRRIAPSGRRLSEHERYHYLHVGRIEPAIAPAATYVSPSLSLSEAKQFVIDARQYSLLIAGRTAHPA